MKRIKSRRAEDIEGWEESCTQLGKVGIVRNPILFATSPSPPRPEGPTAHGYLTFAPKTFCRVVSNKEGDFRGICAFSKDACGPPNMAHGGKSRGGRWCWPEP